MQQFLHEDPTAVIHFACAAVFVLSLAVNAGLFARDSRRLAGRGRHAAVQWTCMALILAAVGWVVLGGWAGLTIGSIAPLYAGEVVAVWAFGVSWLLASRSGADPG